MPLLFLDQPENMTDQMKSILAQMEFTHEILSWESKGVQFCTYLYVPEVHPETHTVFCECEDEAHVLKVYKFLLKLMNCLL